MYRFLGGVLVLLAIGAVGGVILDEYCNSRPSGTPCKTQCKRSEYCAKSYEDFIELNEREREEIVNVHNQIRDEVTSGMHRAHNIPAIPSMNVLSYDLELEFLASCWILQCQFRLEHDAHRRTLVGHPYNQNFYRMTTRTPIQYPEDFARRAVNHWFSKWRELPNLGQRRNGSVEVFRSPAQLMQVVWPWTTYVGCAKMHYGRRLASRSVPKVVHGYHLLCNYYPPANDTLDFMSMTAMRAPCALVGTDGFAHLCGEFRNSKMDAYLAPINFQEIAHSKSTKFSGILNEISIVVVFLVAPSIVN